MTEEVKCLDNCKVKGFVKIYTHDPRYIKSLRDFYIAQNRGLLHLVSKEVDIGDNTITPLGFTVICSVLAGGTSTITHCAVGTGTPTAIALGTEVGTRLAITYKYIINNEFHMDTFYGKNDPNTSSNILTEAGIFNQLAAGGDMYSSKAISITKDTTITMTVSWTWLFA